MKYFGLVFLAQERLVDLSERALDHIYHAEQHDQIGGTAWIEAGERVQQHTQHQPEQWASRVLAAGEPFVRRVLVHSPRGGVDAGEEADDGSEQRAHKATLSARPPA